MRNWQTLYYRVFFWLPTGLVAIFLVVAFFLWVKPIALDEPKRIGREYREVIEDFVAHPERATFIGKRKHGSGWRQVGKINGFAYGHVRDGKDEIIWFERDNGECLAMSIKPIEPLLILPFYGMGSGIVLIIMILLSATADHLCNQFQQERNDFLAAIAHDLTTPLATIKYSVGEDNQSILILCDRLMRIVSNLKCFLRLGDNKPAIKMVQFNLLAAYKEAYELFKIEYQDVFDGEDVSVDCGIDTLVVGDMTIAVQIFWNLLGNDLKYAAPWGKVRVKFYATKGKVNFELIDEGLGMKPSQRRRVFDRYYRGSDARQMGIGGFGIGLCTSREMARLMGGDITLRANTPRGCIFTFSMPSSTQMRQSMV